MRILILVECSFFSILHVCFGLTVCWRLLVVVVAVVVYIAANECGAKSTKICANNKNRENTIYIDNIVVSLAAMRISSLSPLSIKTDSPKAISTCAWTSICHRQHTDTPFTNLFVCIWSKHVDTPDAWFAFFVRYCQSQRIDCALVYVLYAMNIKIFVRDIYTTKMYEE